MTYTPSAQPAIEIALALFVIGVMLPFVLDAIFATHEGDEDSGLCVDHVGHGGSHQASAVPLGKSLPLLSDRQHRPESRTSE